VTVPRFEQLTDQVYTLPPYSSRGRRMMRNDEEILFRAGGKQLMLAPEKDSAGYLSASDIGLRP
jgi:hypothetical protein